MSLRGSGFRVLGPWWFVAPVVAAGVLLIGAGQMRLGGQVMAGGFLIGACVRAVTTKRQAGGLAVRNKVLDVVVLLALAIGVLIASATVKLPTEEIRPPVPRTAIQPTTPPGHALTPPST
jgi:hypothetical protein